MNHIVNTRGGKSTDCLNTIRLLAAFEVLYFHTLEHLSITMPVALDNIVGFFYGVPVFFMMSGYLILMSVGRSASFGQYYKKRFWRIFPELWGAVLIEILVLLVLFSGEIQWGKLALFALTQGTFFQFWTPDFLRPYGCGCPNGALWTICVLIQFYLLAYFTYKLLRGRKMLVWLSVIIVFIGIAYATPQITGSMPEIIGKLYGQTFMPYFWMFLVGAFFSEHKERLLPICMKYWYIFGLITIGIMTTGWDIPLGMYGMLRSIFLFLCLLGFAYKASWLNVKTDISYGVYIYHMTIVNALIALGFTGESLYLLIVTVLTFIISYFSTITIGNLSKRMKSQNQ